MCMAVLKAATCGLGFLTGLCFFSGDFAGASAGLLLVAGITAYSHYRAVTKAN